jgi:hypothetical protein
MVLDHQDGYPSRWRAIVTASERLNLRPETLDRPGAPSRRGDAAIQGVHQYTVEMEVHE